MENLPNAGNITGGTYPARIWTAYMKAALKGSKVVAFPKPAGINKNADPPPPPTTRAPAPPTTSAPPSSAPPTSSPPTPTPSRTRTGRPNPTPSVTLTPLVPAPGNG
jgi:membrane peptidoglycan carboxypeptidase